MEGLTGSGLEDDLPGETAASTFVKGGGGRRDGEVGIFGEFGVGLADFGEGGFFGFVGDGEAGEVGEWGHFLTAALFDEIVGKGGEVGLEGGLDDGVFGLESLDDDAGDVEMSAPDAADDLGEEFEGAFFGGEIGEGETGIGLDNADGGEVGKIEAAGESLGADEDLDFAGFDVVIEVGEVGAFFVVAVEAGDFGFGEDAGEFGLEKFSAEAFMDDAGFVTVRAAGGDFFGVAANVATESVSVGV